MNKFIRLSVFALAIALISSCGGKTVKDTVVLSKQGEVALQYDMSLEELKALAVKHNRPVFIDFYTTWCGPCKLFSAEVLTHPDVIKKLNANFINTKINAEGDGGKSDETKGVEVADLYEVEAYPTLMFIDAEGNVLNYYQGLITTTGFLKLMDGALTE